ncbi:hypothetical protein AVEN_38195-1 [Araneus ventricosus]|uniref:Uncharacterized protein n=1 Tax=Araneus ventricosus TaxID=182803 RepID=A0A4Y2LAA9_ARAVE|nr:hypothetical protein AVEN_38195-1 [Araneus ventricosus]
MIDEDLQKFSESRVMRTIAIGRVPIRNLPKTDKTQAFYIRQHHDELKFHRTKTGIPVEGISTRERIFGIPYDPRKDFAVPVPQRDIDLYLKENYEHIENPVLKDFVAESCCSKECSCILGPNCRCRRPEERKGDQRY